MHIILVLSLLLVVHCQQSMARKRHNKWKCHRLPPTEDSLHSNSLDDDLRLQRLRQKERVEEHERRAVERSVTARDTDEAADDDDVSVDILSPTTISFQLPRHLTVNGATTKWPDFPPELSFLHGFAILQQSPGLDAHKRSRMRRWMHSRYLLDNLENNDRASLLYSKTTKWTDHILPGNMHCSWDMTCKEHLHSSARTLDVASPIDPTSTIGTLPNVATTLQGGWGIYQPSTRHRESRIHTSRWYVQVEYREGASMLWG
jgi:hypothetical protein